MPLKRIIIPRKVMINKPIKSITTVSPENSHKIKLTQIHKPKTKSVQVAI
jgi:hypothetical protein